LRFSERRTKIGDARHGHRRGLAPRPWVLCFFIRCFCRVTAHASVGHSALLFVFRPVAVTPQRRTGPLCPWPCARSVCMFAVWRRWRLWHHGCGFLGHARGTSPAFDLAPFAFRGSTRPLWPWRRTTQLALAGSPYLSRAIDSHAARARGLSTRHAASQARARLEPGLFRPSISDKPTRRLLGIDVQATVGGFASRNEPQRRGHHRA